MSLFSLMVLEIGFPCFWRYFMGFEQISGILQHLFGFAAFTTLTMVLAVAGEVMVLVSVHFQFQFRMSSCSFVEFVRRCDVLKHFLCFCEVLNEDLMSQL